MTLRQIFEASLMEAGKRNAPALKLYEFNYLVNKAVNSFTNKVYNKLEINQQALDDIRVLKSTAFLTPKSVNTANTSRPVSVRAKTNALYEVTLPDDYLHLLNCVCVFKVKKTHRCYDAGDFAVFGAERLTSDSWSLILTDVYNMPSPYHPYFYIHHENTRTNLPTNPTTDISGEYSVSTNTIATSGQSSVVKGTVVLASGSSWTLPSGITSSTTLYKGVNGGYYTSATNAVGVDASGNALTIPVTGNIPVEHMNDVVFTMTGTELVKDNRTLGYPAPSVATATVPGSNLPRTILLDFDGNQQVDYNMSLVEKPAASRAANSSIVRMEIRCGSDNTIYELVEVQVDYIKAPQLLRLTLTLFDLNEDTSQIMEFPDYVCQEIINELVHLLLLRFKDPSLQSLIALDQTIALPTTQTAPTSSSGALA